MFTLGLEFLTIFSFTCSKFTSFTTCKFCFSTLYLCCLFAGGKIINVSKWIKNFYKAKIIQLILVLWDTEIRWKSCQSPAILVWSLYIYLCKQRWLSMLKSSISDSPSRWSLVLRAIMAPPGQIGLEDTKKPIKYWKTPSRVVKIILMTGESKNDNFLSLWFCV